MREQRRAMKEFERALFESARAWFIALRMPRCLTLKAAGQGQRILIQLQRTEPSNTRHPCNLALLSPYTVEILKPSKPHSQTGNSTAADSIDVEKRAIVI